MSEPLSPPQERLILKQFAAEARLPPEILINLLLHAMANHVEVHGTLAIPFHLVTGCTGCPFAHPPANVTPGPWQ